MAKVDKVLVTGATGYLGSWLVKRLLQRGYRVKATVLDKDDKGDLEPLLGLPQSLRENLEIVEANIIEDGDFDSHVDGCDGVFHLAFSVAFNPEADLLKEMMEPAVQGSVNVLKSCAKSSTVKRVVYASSCAAALNCNPSYKILDESCWTDVDAIKKWDGWQYAVAKKFGEEAAAEFAKENNLDLVVINPGYVVGPYLLSRLPSSMLEMKPYFIGVNGPFGISRFSLPAVHTDDVARAFIFLYETPEATGRHMCGNASLSAAQFVKTVSSQYPEITAKMTESQLNEEEEEVDQLNDARGLDSSKLQKLGFEYHHNGDDMINDFIQCTKDKGLSLHQLFEN